MIHIDRQQWAGLAITLLTIFILLGFSIWIVAGNPNPTAISDSIDYLVFADFFRSSFAGSVPEYLHDFFSHTRFPPLYPLLVATFGGGVNNVSPAYWITLISLALCSPLCAWWISQATGNPMTGSLMTMAALVSPGMFLLVLSPMSEPLFMLMMFTAFILAPRTLNSRSSMLAFVLLVALIPLCRMAGLALVFGALLWIWIHRPHQAPFRIAISLLVLAPALLWMIFRNSYPVVSAYSDQFSVDLITSTFGGWIGIMIARPLVLHTAFTEIFSPTAETWLLWALLPMTVFAAVGLVNRLRAFHLDALVLLPYIGLVWIWPFPAEATRFILVVLPILFVDIWDGIGLVWKNLGKAGNVLALHHGVEYIRSIAMPAVLLVISTSLFFTRAIYRILPDIPAEMEPFRRYVSYFEADTAEMALLIAEGRLRIIKAFDAARSVVEKGECLAAVHSSLAWFTTHAEIHVRPIPYPIPQGISAEEEFKKCRYIMVTHLTSPQINEPPLYPLQQVAKFTRPVFVSMYQGKDQVVIAAALLERLDPQNKEP